LKVPYTGAVNFRSGEIGDDLAYYLTESEQIPSAVGLGVELCSGGGVKVAGGFLIQSLPSLKEADMDSIIANIGRLPSLSKFFAEGNAPEDILENLFRRVPYDVLFKTELSYSCPCSRDKVERVFLAMGREELQRLLDKKEKTEVVCDFCKKPYYFQHEDFSAIINQHF
jgi:molecular chaperone Hsp33